MSAADTPGRWQVIVNVGSGAHDRDAIRTQVADAFAAHGIEPLLVFVAGREVIGAARRALDERAPVVVAGGGDGTISGVASVLAGTDRTLGVLPLGTLNHFARDLHIPLAIEGAVATLAAGHAVAVDMGEVNGRTFINNASLGLYPRMVWEREQQRRGGRRKWLAFVVASARVWRHYRRVRVVLQQGDEHRVIHTPFVFAGNNEYQLEGLNLGGRMRLDGGVLHLTMAPGMTRAEMTRAMAVALIGRLQNVGHFESATATAFSIEAIRRRLGVTLDGELTVMHTPLAFRIRPGALRVLVPAP